MLFLHHGFMWRQNELLQYPVHPSDSLWARRWRSSCGTGGGLAFLANGSSRSKDEDQDEHGDRGDGDDWCISQKRRHPTLFKSFEHWIPELAIPLAIEPSAPLTCGSEPIWVVDTTQKQSSHVNLTLLIWAVCACVWFVWVPALMVLNFEKTLARKLPNRLLTQRSSPCTLTSYSQTWVQHRTKRSCSPRNRLELLSYKVGTETLTIIDSKRRIRFAELCFTKLLTIPVTASWLVSVYISLSISLHLFTASHNYVFALSLLCITY